MTLLAAARLRRQSPGLVIPPLPTAGLVARFKATTGVGSSAGRLTTWADQSGNALDATADASAPFVATGLDGAPVVRFDSQANSGMTLGAARLFTARNIAIFIVGRFVPGASNTIASGAGATSGMLRTLPAAAGQTIGLYNATRFATPPMVVRANRALYGTVARTASTELYSNLRDVTGLAAVTATTGNGLTFGHLAGGAGYHSFDAEEILVYEGPPTAQNVADIKAYAAAAYSLRTAAYTKNLVCEGDSITQGINGSGSAVGTQFFQTSYPSQIPRSGIAHWKVSNLGVSGSQMSTLQTRRAGAVGYLDAACSKNVLVGLIGRNDITGADNSATVYANIVSYVQSLITDAETAGITSGLEVWWSTNIASGASLAATNAALNAKIRGTANGGTGNGIAIDGLPAGYTGSAVVRLIDFASILPDPTNTTLYQSDGTHPTQAGAKAMADYVAGLLAAA